MVRVWDPEIIAEGRYKGKYSCCDVNGTFLGYSTNMNPNPDWRKQGLLCEFEHCIENSLLGGENNQLSCFLFQRNCPAGYIPQKCKVLERLLSEVKKMSKEAIGSEMEVDVKYFLSNWMNRFLRSNMRSSKRSNTVSTDRGYRHVRIER